MSVHPGGRYTEMKNKSQKVSGTATEILTSTHWQLKIAIDEDVESIVLALTDHMNDEQRAAFRDKLERYVRKPDRDVIVA